jgi:hypothetical protein
MFGRDSEETSALTMAPTPRAFGQDRFLSGLGIFQPFSWASRRCVQLAWRYFY